MRARAARARGRSPRPGSRPSRGAARRARARRAPRRSSRPSALLSQPRLDLEATTVARAGLVLALALGVGLGAPLALALRGEPERLLSALPWGVTAALALAVAAQWAHAALFAYYLPPGINVRLLKAATVVSILTVSASTPRCCTRCSDAATAGAAERDRDGGAALDRPHRRAALGVSGQPCATARAGHARATGADASRGGGARRRHARRDPAARGAGPASVLFDAAAAGRLRRLRTLEPPIRVAVWRSVATGAYPFRHGVVSDRTYAAPFLRAHPVGRGASQLALALGQRVRAVGTTARRAHQRRSHRGSRAPALWQILGGAGLATTVVGWPHRRSDPRDAIGPVLPESFFDAADLAVPRPRYQPRKPSGCGPRSARSIRPCSRRWATRCRRGAKVAWSRTCGATRLLAICSRARGRRSDRALRRAYPGCSRSRATSFGGYAAVHFDGDSSTVQRKPRSS